MSPVFFFERLPRIYLVVLAAAWLLGAADVDEHLVERARVGLFVLDNFFQK